jgi:hypothetical protein
LLSLTPFRKAQGKAEEKIAQFNALQKEKEAKSRMEAARLEEEKVSRREKIFKAEQRVRFPNSQRAACR